MFIRSSYCAGGACVEVNFTRSSYCGSGCCVEVSHPDHDRYVVRDSKDPDGGTLEFDREEWDAFVKGVKAGEFDPS